MPSMTITKLLFSHSSAGGLAAGVLPSSDKPTGARGRPLGPALLLQILGVPGEVALHAVLLVTGPRDAVVLAGIDHQLGGHAQAAQRLVHLLAAHQRHIEVAFSAQE